MDATLAKMLQFKSVLESVRFRVAGSVISLPQRLGAQRMGVKRAAVAIFASRANDRSGAFTPSQLSSSSLRFDNEV
jgi:hypothetical protein